MEDKKRCVNCEYREIYHEEAMLYFCSKIKDFVETSQVACEDFKEVNKNITDDFFEGL